MSPRRQIAMTAEEAEEFLHEQRVLICATSGIRGWPHLMPLWYLIREKEVWAWTYAASQKVRNLERDNRATLQVEDGEEYHELRGLMIEARTSIHRELEVVAAVGSQLLERYGGGTDNGGLGEAIRAQAAKRVALQFKPERVASWDHRKLGGMY